MEPLALYIHWPFCLSKCPYCDFNSYVRPQAETARFATALRRELAWEAARLGRQQLVSIFFGGGTPSLMEPSAVAALIADACTLFVPTPDLEVTLEANPTSAEAARLADFRAAGVNRLSLGVQALDDDALAALGRRHTAAEARAALSAAQRLFARFSFDLITARPGQTPRSWRAELRRALALAGDHLSVYELTIEPGTPFARTYRPGQPPLPPAASSETLYRITGEETARHGLQAYEISNYARGGGECRHNVHTWRYGAYLGIGPGAHGRTGTAGTLHAASRHRQPERWLAQVERLGHGLAEEVPLSPRQRGREALLLGLRLREGVDAERFAARTGCALAEALEPDMLRKALAAKYVRLSGRGLCATPAGRRRLDSLLAALLR
jgi:oxygen-independent coproporphyrinogen-3 oxidase